jgi:lipoprotein-releasing system ATP-binding protein
MSEIRTQVQPAEERALEDGLHVSDLRKSFVDATGNRLEVLRGISFAAAPGGSVAIIGASGAGKSTLLHILGGLEVADHGSITLGQFAIDRGSASSLAALRRDRIGFIFQFHYLLADLNAVENVALPLLLERANGTTATQHAIDSLTQMGLGDRCRHPVNHLSGGEQQRVAACRALINRPHLVLADEPTGNLDAAAADDLGQLLVAYSRDQHAIVVIATHNERLAQLCDQILEIEDGLLKVVRG